MTREEAKEILEYSLHNNFIGDVEKAYEYIQAVKLAISALSAEGEYIKKEDALAELNKWDWQELYLPIHFKENILDVLPTYSFPDREKGKENTNENRTN